jgi:hypothetical protein
MSTKELSHMNFLLSSRVAESNARDYSNAMNLRKKVISMGVTGAMKN